MKSILNILIYVGIVGMVLGWTLIEQTDITKQHPGYCYSETMHVGAMALGEKRNLQEECVHVSCQEDRFIYFEGCEKINVPGGCEVKKESNKPYPDCCEKAEC